MKDLREINMSINYNALTSKTNILNVLEALKDCINYNLNCIKIATVVNFDKDNLTACCKINNKHLVNIQNDGNQILKEYPLIYAKVHFFGWEDIGATFPINEGMEGFLLFNDRELETWFLTSESGQLAYDRCHDLSDAIFICGLHSKPNIEYLPYLEDCLHLFYKKSNIQIKDGTIIINSKTIINGDTTINGDLQVNGKITATGDIVAGTVSLQHHTHGGVIPGGGSTSEPNQ